MDTKPLTLPAWLIALTLLASLLWPSPAPPSVVDPPKVDVVVPPAPQLLAIEGPDTCKPGEQVELKALGDATWVRWQTEAKYAGPYEGGRVIVFTSATPGRFVFFLSGDVAGKGAGDEHVLTVGTPDPKPPKPDPPGPVVPTVGPFQVSIIYETSETTPELARVFINLRTGSADAYLKANGHTLNILDDDLTDANGKPSVLVSRWAPLGKLPEMVIGTPAGKVVWRGPVPATADGVIEAIKRAGG